MWRTPQTVRDLLARNVDDFGEREAKVAVSYGTGDYIRNTWKELDEASDRIAAGLVELGVQKGQKVACMLANHMEAITHTLRSTRSGRYSFRSTYDWPLARSST